ncbi:MAG: DUF1611 domain-containing protein [Phycisphaerae bacterium]|jgi:uncharacterized NAD-dependent epimerase/dehydratase family protein|nr:DUF1611 domain-containing protein [Phycisphaerae bacterium]HOO17622.1 DUF1611 domain-containing protein [Phycisphaerae bacterium]HPC22117.1 DUF1611 domain-containing protein [Phycisphaerae bacterium]HRS27376.1 DUF1611 domain-containing protein [Phycisphaerae bacterium]HRT42767.1 DUF1611 domain-containing protein [Phycisphaerae bacterium]
MHVLPPYRRILLLTEGQLGAFTSKTAAALLRYRAPDVVGVLDSHAAGTDVRTVFPWSPPVPIVADIAAARTLAPDALFVGIAPPGGALPGPMRQHIAHALAAGMDVVSGLHQFLADDAELAALAQQNRARIFDLRRPPAERTIATARALSTRCRRVLTVGTDGNVGKMVAGLELTAAARQRGLRAEFLATGQTGTMIAGRGVAIDAVVSDFAPGAVEELVLSAADSDICIIEGQGSIAHPGFSAVTLALLHGACPDAMILVHHARRTHYSAAPHMRIPRLAELRAIYESAASLLHPSRVVGVALNPLGCDPKLVREETRLLAQELRIPVCDAICGCTALLDAVLANTIPKC